MAATKPRKLGSKILNMVKSDGWSNMLTYLGSSKDKRTGAEASWSLMTETDSEELFASDEMARKICVMLPEDMMREGFRLVSKDAEEDDLEEAMDYFENLVVTDETNKFTEAMVWGRQYGGAGLVIGTDEDNEESLKEPLDPENLRTIRYLTLLSRHELVAQAINGNPVSSNFGKPETYLIQPRVTGTADDDLQQTTLMETGSIKIHYTRLIRFDGAILPRRLYINNNYWHDSILNALQDDIRDYQAAYASTNALILDFAQAVYKVKNLAAIVTSPDGREEIMKRMSLIEQSRSVLRAAIVDADGEDFERKTTSLQGLDRVLDKISRKFTSATEYPHTTLLGEAPGGLGTTGESQETDYNTTVRSRQKQVLKPRLKALFKLIFAANDGPTRGEVPDFDIEFFPLKMMTQGEEIDARKKQAETDNIYLDQGVLDADEVAESRFGSGDYSFETEIDVNARDRRPPESGEDGGGNDRMDAAPARSRRFNGSKYR